MRRRLLNLVTIVSALLLVAVVTLWARSYWRLDLFGGEVGGLAAGGGSYRGELLWFARRATREKSGGDQTDAGEERDRPYFSFQTGEIDSLMAGIIEDVRANAAWKVAGFSYTSDPSTPPPLRVLITPSWFVALLLGALPARRLWVLRTRRRRGRLGLCKKCGYDLRASPGRCPECGAATAAGAP